ncbi:hypothetical protein MMC25_001864 [Agyrium rufum]|nr:hypothetical protein [Agyrium rufum]
MPDKTFIVGNSSQDITYIPQSSINSITLTALHVILPGFFAAAIIATVTTIICFDSIQKKVEPKTPIIIISVVFGFLLVLYAILSVIAWYKKQRVLLDAYHHERIRRYSPSGSPRSASFSRYPPKDGKGAGKASKADHVAVPCGYPEPITTGTNPSPNIIHYIRTHDQNAVTSSLPLPDMPEVEAEDASTTGTSPAPGPKSKRLSRYPGQLDYDVSRAGPADTAKHSTTPVIDREPQLQTRRRPNPSTPKIEPFLLGQGIPSHQVSQPRESRPIPLLPFMSYQPRMNPENMLNKIKRDQRTGENPPTTLERGTS